MKSHIPNMLSYLRIIVSPIFLYLFVWGDAISVLISGLLFTIGSVSDYLDGWYARKYEVVTEYGVFIDPLADKVLTTAAFASFVILDVIPLWPVIVILVRDIFTTVLRIYAEKRGKPVVTSKSAKLKTALQLFYLSVVLAFYMLQSSGLFGINPEEYDKIIYSSAIDYSLYALTLFTIWTGIEYVYQNRKILFH